MKKVKKYKTYIRLSGTMNGKDWVEITTQDPRKPFYIDVDSENIFYKRLAVTTVKLECL